MRKENARQYRGGHLIIPTIYQLLYNLWILTVCLAFILTAASRNLKIGNTYLWYFFYYLLVPPPPSSRVSCLPPALRHQQGSLATRGYISYSSSGYLARRQSEWKAKIIRDWGKKRDEKRNNMRLRITINVQWKYTTECNGEGGWGNNTDQIYFGIYSERCEMNVSLPDYMAGRGHVLRGRGQANQKLAKVLGEQLHEESCGHSFILRQTCQIHL